jgi:hypothetical protein
MHTQFNKKTCKELTSVGWMQMVDDMFWGQALVNTIINLPVPKEAWNFLTSQEKFQKMALLYKRPSEHHQNTKQKCKSTH